MWTRAELKEKAWYLLRNCCYWKAVLVAFIFVAVGGLGGGGGSAGGSSNMSDFDSISGPEVAAILIIVLIVVLIALVFGFVFSAFISNPVIVGCSRFFTLSCMQDANVNEIGVAFKNGVYMNVVKTMFKMTIEIFLWSLLFVIPGIIKSYEYRMVRYIVAENPNISWEDAKQLSINMMEGNKMAAFGLDLSFIGWYCLSLLTCGLLSIFWVNPYKCLTDAELYLTLRANMFVQQP